jgi:hypothetical protein
MITRVIVFFAASLFMASFPALAKKPIGQLLDANGECYVHEYVEGEIIRLNVAPYSNLHIQLHKPVYALKLGGGRQWGGTYTKGIPHVWIKSKTVEGYSGQTTSLTVLDENLTAYNFVLNRRENPGYTCAVIKPDQQSVFDSEMKNWKSPDKKRAEIAERNARSAYKNAERRVDAVKQHMKELQKNDRANLYTDYEWEEKGVKALGTKKFIRSVLDDGLFTMITLNKTSIGLMSIYGVYQDKEHQVQMDYDPRIMQYTITGVYSEIRMRYQDAVVTIKRLED